MILLSSSPFTIFCCNPTKITGKTTFWPHDTFKGYLSNVLTMSLCCAVPNSKFILWIKTRWVNYLKDSIFEFLAFTHIHFSVWHLSFLCLSSKLPVLIFFFNFYIMPISKSVDHNKIAKNRKVRVTMDL